MTADAHRQQRQLYRSNQVDGPQFKLKEDPRVTRVGRLLRVTNLDEIPQLINVLRGQMSLVGPRPSPFRENQICVPWRRARLSVRPGITGLWQVCRDEDRTEGDFHEWIYYDLDVCPAFLDLARPEDPAGDGGDARGTVEGPAHLVCSAARSGCGLGPACGNMMGGGRRSFRPWL